MQINGQIIHTGAGGGRIFISLMQRPRAFPFHLRYWPTGKKIKAEKKDEPKTFFFHQHFSIPLVRVSRSPLPVQSGGSDIGCWIAIRELSGRKGQ